MIDLLNPDGVRELLKELGGLAYMDKLAVDLDDLCRDYLTLWDRNRQLEERFITARQIFERYQVPLDIEVVKMVDAEFWNLL